MTDTELLDLLRRDRAAGTEALLTRYRPLLRYVIGGILAESGDGEDCLSEVCLVLWQKLDSFDPAKGSLSAWLTAVTRNTALNHLKAHRRREAHTAEATGEPVSPDTPEQALLRRERAERLKAALGGLRDRDRQLFYRRYYYLQPLSQIAAEMGMTERAAEGRLYRLRQRLRQELGGDEP